MIRNRCLPALLGALAAFMLLASCHGNGSHPAIARPPVVTLHVAGPVFDTVFIGGFNAYAVSVRPGSTYKISMTGPTDDVDLLFFGPDATYTNLARCSVDNTAIIGVSPEDCVVTANSGVLYFATDGTYLFFESAGYTIDVEELPVIDLALSIPANQTRNIKTGSIFSVPVTPGSRYTAGVTGLNGDVSMHVFADGDLTTQSACAIDNTLFTGTTPEDCTLAAGSSTLFFIADPLFSSVPNATFTAFAAPSPTVAAPVDEGTIGAPVSVSLDMPTVGQAGFNGTSFYSAPVTTAGARYTVSITGLTANANLTVYNDASFTTPATCTPDNTFFTGTTPEDCTLTAAGTTLYFSVTADTASGGVAYLSLVSSGP